MRTFGLVVNSERIVGGQCSHFNGLGDRPLVNFLVHREIRRNFIACFSFVLGNNRDLFLRANAEEVLGQNYVMDELCHIRTTLAEPDNRRKPNAGYFM